MLKLLNPILRIPNKNLQIIRYLALGVTVIFLLVAIIGPMVSPLKMPFSRINTSHSDVSKGIYNVLRNQAGLATNILTSSSGIRIPVDSSLSNSEIDLFSEYAQRMIEGSPQYLVTSLYKYCYCYYDSEYVGQYSETSTTLAKKTKSSHTNERMDCYMNTKDALNYIAQLEQVNLQIVVSYAGMKDNYAYTKHNLHRSKLFRLVPGSFYFGIASQIFIMAFSFVLFGFKDVKSELNHRKAVFVHGIALLTILSFISICVGVSLMTYLVGSIKNEISTNLSLYGVAEFIGETWFIFAWCLFCMAFISMMLWVIPLWCANPEPEHFHDNESLLVLVPFPYNFNRRTVTGMPQGKRNISRTYVDLKDPEQFTDEVYTSDNDTGGSKEDIHRSDSGSYEMENLYSQRAQEKANVIGEAELRQMGESLSRKATVRRLNSIRDPKRSNPSLKWPPTSQSGPSVNSTSNISSNSSGSYTHPGSSGSFVATSRTDLSLRTKGSGHIKTSLNSARFPVVEASATTLGSNGYPIWNSRTTHTQEEVYDGYRDYEEISHYPLELKYRLPQLQLQSSLKAISRSATTKGNVPSRSPFEDDDETNQAENLLNAFLRREARKSISGESFLNDDEMEYLDMNNYVNKI